MSFILFAFFSCNSNEDVIENNQTTTESILNLFKNTKKPVSPIGSLNGFILHQANLIAGQNEIAGTVIVSFTKTDLVVTYTTNNNWSINETHLYVGEKNLIPLTKKGNPKIGKFDYKGEHNAVNIVTYTIPLEEIKGIQCLSIAAHAVVSSNSGKSETAWAEGTEFPGKSWAMYHSFCDTPGNGGGEGGGIDTN